MPQRAVQTVRRALTFVVGLLILKVTAVVALGYVNYLPPNFESDFLRGREGYFFGGYRWAFYPHIAAGPVTLVLGLLLMSDRFRGRFPVWHRRLGRVQGLCVLLLVAPSGLWMARHTATGQIAGIGFAILAVLTGACVALGWRAAVRREYAVHRRWMTRCFLLLCSAVVLRLFGGLGMVLAVSSLWYDPIASWSSWLVPLAVYEVVLRLSRRPAGIAMPAREAV